MQTVKKMFRTEDTGKMFEMAICMANGTPFVSKTPYKYDMPKEALISRLQALVPRTGPLTHTAQNGGRYDFSSPTDPLFHLSAKTTKKDGKVAPQVIGQPKPQKFCDELGIVFTDIPTLKQHIQENIPHILPKLEEYTFSSPIVYYNEKTSRLCYLKQTTPIDWSNYTFTWTKPASSWNGSSTLKVRHNEKDVAILEIQFHSKSRANMAIRWCFETVLDVFKHHFEIVEL
jgi:hypothetical protein